MPDGTRDDRQFVPFDGRFVVEENIGVALQDLADEANIDVGHVISAMVTLGVRAYTADRAPAGLL